MTPNAAPAATTASSPVKKVLFLVPFPHGKAPTQRLKFEQYYDYFREHGYELTLSNFVSDDCFAVLYKEGHFLRKAWGMARGYATRTRDLLRLHEFDVVYVHLWATPFFVPFYEWLVKQRAKKIVYDIDDMIFLADGELKVNLKAVLRGRLKPLYLFKASDHVITCTPVLNDFARKYNDACTDISSTMNTERLVPVNPYSNDREIVIGWTGTFSTRPFLDLLRPALIRLRKERKFRFRVIGNFDYEFPEMDLDYIPWTKEKEVEDLQRIDIGLYPVEKSLFTLGKSGLKALTYMALGIPTVATDYGTIHRIIESGRSGYLCDTNDQWYETLKYLVNHPEERRRVGQAGRDVVLSRFSVEANRDTYLGILDSLVHPEARSTVRHS